MITICEKYSHHFKVYAAQLQPKPKLEFRMQNCRYPQVTLNNLDNHISISQVLLNRMAYSHGYFSSPRCYTELHILFEPLS